jgi:plasmid maintenance system antidote protein VapI|tara:strand:+ start:202 stop:393 length:192 start_codon:yes stop_codon:yes gene_type:complete
MRTTIYDNLTPRQKELLEIIKVSVDNATQTDYANEMGVTRGRINFMINALRKRYTREEILDAA